MSEKVAAPRQESHSEQWMTAKFASSRLAAGFVGRWNRLVSTTNWEKGCIICEWREALLVGGQAVTEYSDEAWAQLVGHVTSQHVGRLRRVFNRFGAVHQQYESLYWSHFQAALDWSDAEMWLEGAIQNGWSVSQMRGQRWEILGTPAAEQAEQMTLEVAVNGETLDEDAAEPVSRVQQPGTEPAGSQEVDDPSTASQQAAQSVSGADALGMEDAVADDLQEQASAEPATQATTGQRLGVACADLPDQIAEAFEQFKLAIIAQRRQGWRAISREGVIECLDALKELVG